MNLTDHMLKMPGELIQLALDSPLLALITVVEEAQRRHARTCADVHCFVWSEMDVVIICARMRPWMFESYRTAHERDVDAVRECAAVWRNYKSISEEITQ